MKGISWFGSTWVAVGIVLGAAIIFLLFKYKRESLFISLSSTIWILTYVIKIIINRPRPSADFVNKLVDAQHQSFPSGHTSFYVVFFGLLVFLMLHLKGIIKPLRYSIIVFSLILIFSVPFSRIYLGAHWFTDVAAGFILGLLVLYILIRIYLKKIKL
ncbi:phosphatase PAP2 family protein [Algoriphagus antarcticus]|uniref:Undecaprenyl-diphosphatase n=1 Tax=Algoriphagus antarcticus TaxID=238540 RepID=A0A3E0D4J1_9BACT|nr:phosphatase PAP2 family protein [Algoriphagus antarcticus]REG77596.1 undecaprenyl-diphosphatase [Algoriphagus antarcticus]